MLVLQLEQVDVSIVSDAVRAVAEGATGVSVSVQKPMYVDDQPSRPKSPVAMGMDASALSRLEEVVESGGGPSSPKSPVAIGM